MKYRIGLFTVGAAFVLAACGGESADNTAEQPADTGVLNETEQVVEEVVEEAKPRETLDIVETQELIKNQLMKLQMYEGTFKLDEEYTMAGVKTETNTELMFQNDFSQPFTYNVKGTEDKVVDGTKTTTEIHRFKKKDDSQYVLVDGVYEKRDYNNSDYNYTVMWSSPWQNVGGYFGFEEAYNAATVAEQDEDYIYLTTDLAKEEQLATLAQTSLFKIHSSDEASSLRNFPEYKITEGTYTQKLDRATQSLLTIEWDFKAEGKNYIDETLELDHHSIYEVTNTTNIFEIDDMQSLADDAVAPAGE